MKEEDSTDLSSRLLMPLVTYTEGMPEFLEHQDTLCIRRRGTKPRSNKRQWKLQRANRNEFYLQMLLDFENWPTIEAKPYK